MVEDGVRQQSTEEWHVTASPKAREDLRPGRETADDLAHQEGRLAGYLQGLGFRV
jgi:hypothetical protein